MTPAKQRVLILGLVIIGMLAAGFFGLRAFHAFRKFSGQRPPPLPPAGAQAPETDVELIREWMTIPFIAKTYRVPPPVLFDALGISPRGNDGKSLKQLNEEYFPNSPGIVLELVKAAVRANQPPPTSIPPLTPLPAAP
jgi:hypothetical protein